MKKKRLFRYFPKKYTELNHENLSAYKLKLPTCDSAKKVI